MKRYWVVKNITGEDVPLKISLWSGQEVDDVFHANETAVINNSDAIYVLRYVDPLGEYFSIEVRYEDDTVPWHKEGF